MAFTTVTTTGRPAWRLSVKWPQGPSWTCMRVQGLHSDKLLARGVRFIGLDQRYRGRFPRKGPLHGGVRDHEEGQRRRRYRRMVSPVIEATDRCRSCGNDLCAKALLRCVRLPGLSKISDRRTETRSARKAPADSSDESLQTSPQLCVPKHVGKVNSTTHTGNRAYSFASYSLGTCYRTGRGMRWRPYSR